MSLRLVHPEMSARTWSDHDTIEYHPEDSGRFSLLRHVGYDEHGVKKTYQLLGNYSRDWSLEVILHD